MSDFGVMKAVYCYLFPETWAEIKEVEARIPREFFLTGTPAATLQERLSPLFSPPLILPATRDGTINLDELHVPVIERIVARYAALVPGLDGFANRYPTNGSSEGIFKLLARLKAQGVNKINVLDGEYEGFSAYAGHESLEMHINTHSIDQLRPEKIPPGTWFVSNPSARDGNILPEEIVPQLCNAGHTVLLDLAYVGSTRPHVFDVSHENIAAIFLSLSKPYGVFRYRIGFTFTRAPVQPLYGNKWFKDDARLLEGLRLVETLGPDESGSSVLYNRYHQTQADIVDELNGEFGLGLRQSDALLLAHLPAEATRNLGPAQQEMIAPFRRGQGYRFCLTPRFEKRLG